MDAKLTAKLDELCRYTWRVSDGAVNRGGCAGFAGLVGAVLARNGSVPWAHLCSAPYETDYVVELWRRGRNTPRDVQCDHVVCCVETAGVAYAVDAEFGVMPLREYAERLRYELNWHLHEEFRAPWRMAWRAYKMPELWNSWFDRRDMQRIVRRARRMFGSFSLVRQQ